MYQCISVALVDPPNVNNKCVRTVGGSKYYQVDVPK